MKQFAEFGLAATVKVVAPSNLVSEDVLSAQGDAALGIYSNSYYTPSYDIPRNRSFTKAAAIGIDVDRHKRLALVMSGGLSGLAGVLFAIHQNFVSPELLFWALSGEVVVIALLGGLGTLYGSR